MSNFDAVGQLMLWRRDWRRKLFRPTNWPCSSRIAAVRSISLMQLKVEPRLIVPQSILLLAEVEDGARTLNRSSLLHPCKTSRLSGEVTSSERSVRLAASRPPVHEDTRKDQFHRMRGEDSSSILRAIHAERNLNIAGMANNGYQGR